MNIRSLSAVSVVGASLSLLPWLAACSAESPAPSHTGGSHSSGGSVPTSSGSGGQLGVTTGGTTSTSGGNAPGTGGLVATGGVTAATGGSSSGGSVTTTGGSTNGGSLASGGVSNTGGNAASSGGAASGGTPTGGSAGASQGGSTSTGGNTGKGGSTSTGGASGGGSCDLATLAQYAPKGDAELAEMFAEYLSDEVGAVTCASAAPAGTTRTITQPIFVPVNGVYDGKGETLTAEPTAMKCDLTPGESAESQRPYFLLAPGASVKNVTIAYPGCEGIHMMGDNVLDNISWIDAGEDAASVRSYFPGGKITISNSDGAKAGDKMFQFNAPCNVRIENFTGADMGKLVRQNGDTTFELHVDLNNVNVTGVISAVVQSDSPLCYVRHHNLVYQFTGSGDKSDRVFRDVPPANVTAY